MYKYFIENKEFENKILKLEKICGKKILKKLKSESNDINFLSKLSEIKFGILLSEIFIEGLSYEPNISNLKPDWLINANNQKIIFEVLRINPKNEILDKIIEDFKNEIDIMPQKGIKKTFGIFNDYSKILYKETTYRDLIINDNFKIIICVDSSSFEKFISIEDFQIFFNFNSDYSPISKYQSFVENVSGLLVIPFMGEKTFLENYKSKFPLNRENLTLLNNRLNYF